MKIWQISALALLSLSVLPVPSSAAPSSGGGGHVKKVLHFATMFGVDGAFVGATNPVAGVPGDELPWEIKSASGHLDSNGRLKISIKGLVFAHDQSVPPQLQGTNDEANFRALVSCQTDDGLGGVTMVTLTTDGFAATTKGNCKIDTTVALPNPCIAPVVLVLAGSEDKWFAATGVEADDG
jgi:hypothetical protein